jgi:hypothetical protein
MTPHEIHMDWLRCFADCTSVRDGVNRMRTETLEAFAPVLAGPALKRLDPDVAASIGRAIRDEIARRATWDGYVDTEGLPS